MTRNMQQAGVDSLAANKDKDPAVVVAAVYDAILAAKQKEAMEKYWKAYE